MAIVQNPITGRSRKSFGNAVFSTQFGKNTLRSKALEVKNPRSEGQVQQRTKFTQIVGLIRQTVPVINDAYNGQVKGMSPYNKVVSLNVKNAFDANNILDYSKLVFCDNVGNFVKNASVTFETNRYITAFWDSNAANQKETESKVSLILVNTNTEKILYHSNLGVRDDSDDSLQVPLDWVGATVAAYLIVEDYSSNTNQSRRVLINYIGKGLIKA